MKLWVDDVRPCPDGWFWAKTYAHAIEILENPPAGGITDASLDHDLGYAHLDSSGWEVMPGPPKQGYDAIPGISDAYDDESPTGYDLLMWMTEHDIWPSESIAVHSANIVGAKRMAGVIERYGPFTHKEKYNVQCGKFYAGGWKYTNAS